MAKMASVKDLRWYVMNHMTVGSIFSPDLKLLNPTLSKDEWRKELRDLQREGLIDVKSASWNPRSRSFTGENYRILRCL